MYICICNALKQDDIKKACDRACQKNGEEILAQAGCKPQCGKCIEYIEDFIIPEQVPVVSYTL